MAHQYSDRATRERDHHNQGLQRETYVRVFRHADYFWRLERNRINATELRHGHQGHMLELGSTGWATLGSYGIRPKQLHCINISEVDLDKGRALVPGNQNQPTFHLMDAHVLEFPDGHFDVVFGSSILHHLDFCRALEQIQRVLKPNGKMVFLEPLGINPVSKLVRLLTPQARTPDERPLGFAELGELRRRLECRFYYQQMLSVPAGVLSSLLFREPDNALMRAAYHLDRGIDLAAPPLRPLFRNLVVVGMVKTLASQGEARPRPASLG